MNQNNPPFRDMIELKIYFVFWISKIVNCLLTKTKAEMKIIVALYVDDFLIFSKNSVETDNLKHVFGAEFKLKDLGPVMGHANKCR